MKKNGLTIVSTLLVILLLNYIGAFIAKVHFMEAAFFVGLACSAGIKFFNSSGGMTTNAIRMQAQAQTGMKVEEEKNFFQPGMAFYAALAYTAIALIGTFVYYKEYFM